MTRNQMGRFSRSWYTSDKFYSAAAAITRAVRDFEIDLVDMKTARTPLQEGHRGRRYLSASRKYLALASRINRTFRHRSSSKKNNRRMGTFASHRRRLLSGQWRLICILFILRWRGFSPYCYGYRWSYTRRILSAPDFYQSNESFDDKKISASSIESGNLSNADEYGSFQARGECVHLQPVLR